MTQLLQPLKLSEQPPLSNPLSEQEQGQEPIEILTQKSFKVEQKDQQGEEDANTTPKKSTTKKSKIKKIMKFLNPFKSSSSSPSDKKDLNVENEKKKDDVIMVSVEQIDQPEVQKPKLKKRFTLNLGRIRKSKNNTKEKNKTKEEECGEDAMAVQRKERLMWFYRSPIVLSNHRFLTVCFRAKPRTLFVMRKAAPSPTIISS